MKKYQVKSASTDHLCFMERCGFRHPPGCGWVSAGFASHMIPNEGLEFYVYIHEPSVELRDTFRHDREDWRGYDGFFVLVKVEDGKEVLVDTGPVVGHHLGEPSFYGKGIKIPSGTWSLHC